LRRCANAGFKLRGQKTRLQGNRDFLGKSDPDKAAGRHRVAVMNQPHGLLRRHHFVAPRARPHVFVEIEIGMQNVSSSMADSGLTLLAAQ